MTPTEIAECHLKSTGSSMDAVIVPGATKDDLDLEIVRRYMRKAVQEKRRDYSENDDPWSVLKKLEWVKSESEITRAAYLLFAKCPQRKFSQATVHAGAFKADGAVIYHYGSGVKRMRNECDKNGSPYPIWTSEKGEFCIRFPARTPESAQNWE